MLVTKPKELEKFYAKITENDILNGSLVTKESYLKRIAHKLSKIPDNFQNPFDNNN